MRIRDAQPEDAAGLTRLLAALGYPDDEERVLARAQDLGERHDSFLVVAEDGEVLAGLASATVLPLFHEDGAWCRLSALVVAESHRRRGLARALVAEVERRALEAGCLYLEVTSGERSGREAAHAFYESLGLEQVSRRYLKEL
ncbi:MAG: GNAT family N-acetyltransferase [Gaiellaceae bacterium]